TPILCLFPYTKLFRSMLASGFVDAIVEASLQPYDIQALIPIIEGAGGVVSTWDGSPADSGGAIVACGDVRLHKKLVELLRHAARSEEHTSELQSRENL